MSRKRPARTGNPDLRRQKHVPAPPIEEIEQEIFSLLSPRNFKPLKLYKNEDQKKFRDRILTLPVGGLLIFDLGFFKFPWFDAFTQANKFFVTRLREKTSYRVIRCLANAPFYRDEIIDMGEYRSNPRSAKYA